MENVIGEKISGFLFTLALVAIIIVVILSNVTTYDSMSSLIENVVKEQKMAPADFNESDFPQKKQELADDCSKSSTDYINVELENNRNATLNCTKVSAMQTPGDLFSLVAISGFNEAYYRQYNCSFFSCLSQSQTNFDKANFLLSQKANESYKNMYWITIVAAAVTGLAIVFFSGNLLKAARNLGWAFAVIGVGFVFALLFRNINLPFGTAETGTSVSLPLFANIIPIVQNYFLAYFIIGAVLLVTGYVGSYLANKNSNKKKKS
ncbi:MAG: hypothetical protein PHC66_03175 [Candidatus Nanoarchaeia archaeon]|nr:hypothetical protein [Candidatus Nanoarchaeia archaeon]MDD5239436.1 hypothetical protein [Candidatus Nanoarchaeia archaeon]